MKKLFLFLFALTVAALPFGNAAFARVHFGPTFKVSLSVNAEGDSITATSQVKLDRGHEKYHPTVAVGFFDFYLYKGDKRVAKETKRTTWDDKTTKATVKFDGLAPGSYKVVATFKGEVKSWNGEKHQVKDYIKTDKRCKIEAPQEEPQEPGDGDGDDNNGDGDNNGNNNGGNDGQNGDNNNGKQPEGNDGKGDDNGDNNGKDGNSGTIQNPGSGNNPATGGKLPKTATSLPLNAMLGGLLTLAGGAILFARRLVG